MSLLDRMRLSAPGWTWTPIVDGMVVGRHTSGNRAILYDWGGGHILDPAGEVLHAWYAP